MSEFVWICGKQPIFQIQHNYTHNPPAAPEHPIVEVDAGPKQVVTGQN